MKFQYIGDGKQSPENIRTFGHDFVLKGEPVEVLDPHAIKKLMGCATFVHEPVLASPVEPIVSIVSVQVDLPGEEDEGDDIPEVVVEPKKSSKLFKKAKK